MAGWARGPSKRGVWTEGATADKAEVVGEDVVLAKMVRIIRRSGLFAPPQYHVIRV